MQYHQYKYQYPKRSVEELIDVLIFCGGDNSLIYTFTTIRNAYTQNKTELFLVLSRQNWTID